MHIESTLPLWLVLPLVALAIFVVWMIYFRKQEESAIIKPIRWVLAISRALVIIIVGLLIISPWIRTTVTQQDKPYFIIAQDNSVSITPARDSSALLASRVKLLSNVEKSLANRFEVKKLLFGARTIDGEACNFSDPITDPDELFTYLKAFGQTHHLGGVLLTSDGVSTRGLTFPEAGRNFPCPITVLASGDSTPFPDVRIQEVVCNEWVRKKSTFPVRVYYNTGDYTGGSVIIQLSDLKGVIEERVVKVADQASPDEEFRITAPEKGTMQLMVKIIPDEPDKNQDNNIKRFTVRVIEKEGNILCLYESPHPDIDAMVQSVKSTSALNFYAVDIADFKGTDKDYDLIVLHGLPSLKHPIAELLKEIADKQVPELFILGNSTDPDLFNQLHSGLTVGDKRKSDEAAQGTMSQSFTLFTLPIDFQDHLSTWPPLILNYDRYTLDPGSQVCMSQKIMGITLGDPLVAFSGTQGRKQSFICGNGIWLWRLHEYLEHKNHDYFDDWLSRTFQYLMLDDNKDRLRIDIPEETYAYTPVRINGHLLNHSLEAVNDPEVLFTLVDSAGQRTEYQMGKVNDYYELNINGFTPGMYRYSAETKLGDEKLNSQGVLTMMTRPVEQKQPVADFAALRSLSTTTGGQFFRPDQERELISYISNRKPSDLTVRRSFRWYDLINLKGLLPVLMVLLAMEWFLRRWFGIR